MDIISAYYSIAAKGMRCLQSGDINHMLKSAVTALGLDKKGFPPSSISSHCLLAGVAMAMHLMAYTTSPYVNRATGCWTHSSCTSMNRSWHSWLSCLPKCPTTLWMVQHCQPTHYNSTHQLSHTNITCYNNSCHSLFLGILSSCRPPLTQGHPHCTLTLPFCPRLHQDTMVGHTAWHPSWAQRSIMSLGSCTSRFPLGARLDLITRRPFFFLPSSHLTAKSIMRGLLL